MAEALIVYNPAAGRFPSRMLTERAAEVLRSQGWRTHLEQTNGGPHITELARQAVKDNLTAFFIAGGDGSINYATAGLVGSQTALGVLPAGTANVWAQELGLPGLAWTRWMALEESARLLGEAKIRAVDVGYCNDNPFLLWAGAGLDAFVVHRIEPRRRWEKHFAIAQYATSIVRHASYWGGMNLNVIADGEIISGQYILAVASNIHLYAGGWAEISPNACLDDGSLDLWLFAGDTLLETFQHAWDMFSGRHLKSERARRIPFQSLELTSESQLFVQLDGEPFKPSKTVSLQVRPRSLRVLIPQKAPRKLFAED